MIWDLENSENILDRQKYADRIKGEFIPKVEANLKRINKEWQEAKMEIKPEAITQENWNIYINSKISGIEYEYNLEKKFLKNLKIRLSNYDVYNQKMESPCQVCKEVVCVCYTIEEKPLEEEIKTLF